MQKFVYSKMRSLNRKRGHNSFDRYYWRNHHCIQNLTYVMAKFGGAYYAFGIYEKQFGHIRY